MRLQVTILLASILLVLCTVECAAQETRCLTATELNDVTDYLCARARAKEVQYDQLRSASNDYLIRAVSAEAKLEEYQGIDFRRVELERELAVTQKEKDDRVSKIWVVVYVAGALIVGGAAGYGISAL